MRARRRNFLSTLLFAAALALVPIAGPAVTTATADGTTCSNGTTWDNILRRCV